MPDNTPETYDAAGYLKPLRDYKRRVRQLFPQVPRRCLDVWSLHESDALVLGLFLQRYPREVVALDVGTFLGASALYLAAQPGVSRVVSVDPNPTVAEEVEGKLEELGIIADLEPLQDLRALEVARAALAESGPGQKVEVREGTINAAASGDEPVEIPEVGEGETLLAFVDGLHTREGVAGDLESIFSKDQRTIAVLDDCRRLWGPFVQAGVVDFMGAASSGYRFRLFGDLCPGLASSNLGVVYPDAERDEVEKTLRFLEKAFSARLDPLRLLEREAELVEALNDLGRQVERLEKAGRIGGESSVEKRGPGIEAAAALKARVLRRFRPGSG